MSGSPVKKYQSSQKSFSSLTSPTLTGGNRQKLGKRRPKNNIVSPQVKASIINSQIWPSSTNDLAIKALNISALSILKTMRLCNSLPNKVYLFDTQTPSSPKEKGRKIYISLYLHAKKMTKSSFFLDNGADISLIHESEIKKILTPQEINKYKFASTHTVVTFNDEQINILYDITLPWSHSKYGPTIDLTFSVYRQEKVHGFVFGQDSMETMGMIMGYTGQTPFVKITCPIKADIETRYEFPENIETCSTTITLDPHETRIVPFTPHPLSNIRKGDQVLISESKDPLIHVIPSRFKAFALSTTPLAAFVTNLSDKVYTGKVHAQTESIENCNIVGIDNIKLLPPSLPIIQEALPYQNLPAPMKTLNIIEPLPITNKQVTPLSSFLIRTPYESTNITHPTSSPQSGSLHPFKDDTKTNSASACYKTTNNRKLINELQSIPFGTLTPDKPEQVQDIPVSLTLPQGYEIPCHLPQTVEDLLQLDKYDELHQKYIKDIFVDTFPTVVSQHNYDVGSLSDTLGYYKIQLKDNTPLPPFKRMYYLAPSQKQQMRDILDFLLKYKIIERASQNSDVVNLFASAAYLVPKPDSQSAARMIIDFRMLNEAILTAPAVIPNLTNTLQALRNKYMFSVSDFRQAYFSISLDPSSRALTRFVTDHGSFHMLKTPMGLSTSPSCYSELTHRMVHMRPRLDDQGNPIFLEKNVVDLEHDHIHGCEIFYDDLIFATELCPTYAETVKTHYALIKRVIERLTFHKAKLSLNKSLFGQTHVKFLGW